MKCMSCSEKINSKFKHAIESNTCPFCGSLIMEEVLKNLLTDLRSVMDKLSAHPEELKDFLHSNYSLINESDIKNNVKHTVTHNTISKVTDTVNNSAHEDLDLDDNEDENSGTPLLNSEKMNLIMQRAGANKINNRKEDFKNLVNRIKSGSLSTNQIASLPDDTIDALDRNELSEIESAVNMSVNNGGVDSFMTDSNQDSDSYDDEIPSHVLNFANKKSGSNLSYHDSKDLERLQNMVKKARSQGGKINRSH